MRADENIYTLDYILSQPTLHEKRGGVARVMPKVLHDRVDLHSEALDNDWIGFGDAE